MVMGLLVEGKVLLKRDRGSKGDRADPANRVQDTRGRVAALPCSRGAFKAVWDSNGGHGGESSATWIEASTPHRPTLA